MWQKWVQETLQETRDTLQHITREEVEQRLKELDQFAMFNAQAAQNN